MHISKDSNDYMRASFLSFTVQAGNSARRAYSGLDYFNGTTPDFNKNGTYSSLTFTEEAIRIIDQKVLSYN